MLLCDMFSRKSRGFFYVWLRGQLHAQVFMPSKTYEFACANVMLLTRCALGSTCMHACVRACALAPSGLRACMFFHPTVLYACMFSRALGSVRMHILSHPRICMHACSFTPLGLHACMFSRALGSVCMHVLSPLSSACAQVCAPCK